MNGDFGVSDLILCNGTYVNVVGLLNILGTCAQEVAASYLRRFGAIVEFAKDTQSALKKLLE